MQELFQYPDMDLRNSSLDVNYIIDVYLQHVETIIEQHCKVQGSMTTDVLKLDGNFKVCSF